MYVVIFRAKMNQLDTAYLQTAAALRQRALDHHGCVEFTAVIEGDEEIALSYWHNLDDIRRWQDDAQHRVAQAQGRAAWYTRYRVEITRVERSYQFAAEATETI